MSEQLIKQGAKATGEAWRDNWITPNYLWDAIREFSPEVEDACPINATFDTLAEPGRFLEKDIYVNPPFSRYLEFVKAIAVPQYFPAIRSQLWIMHHDSSTERQRMLMRRGTIMCMLYERVKFIDPRTGEPSWSSAVGKSQSIIYIGPSERNSAFKSTFRDLGKVVLL